MSEEKPDNGPGSWHWCEDCKVKEPECVHIDGICYSTKTGLEIRHPFGNPEAKGR